MRYALVSISAILICIGVSILIVLLINKKHKMKGWLKAIIIPISSILLTNCLMLTYFAFNYRATEHAKSYLKSDDVIALDETKHYYHFDNKSSDKDAIIFYCGAKVDPVAYSPLCNEISHLGIDVYLIKMPLYVPLLRINAANEIALLNKHKNLYMMGHSLGGTTASLYLSNTKYNSFKGIIFLASYPTKKLNDSYKCLSIYGTNDKVINRGEYNKNSRNFPAIFQEIVIEGGNHSGFGDYGFQRRDGVASITKENQINITKTAVVEFINNN